MRRFQMSNNTCRFGRSTHKHLDRCGCKSMWVNDSGDKRYLPLRDFQDYLPVVSIVLARGLFAAP
jgi:hypothetical protein